MKKNARDIIPILPFFAVKKQRAIFYLMNAFCLFVFGLLLCACPNVPNDLENRIYLYDAKVKLISEKGDTVNSLQVPEHQKFFLFAKITPKNFEDSLQYFWTKNDSLLSTEKIFSHSSESEIYPDSLTLKDEAGNSFGIAFEVIINSPPEIKSILTPLEGDTLYGDEKTPILFSWNAVDPDNDTLLFYLENENGIYPAGMWNYIHLANFSEGKHKIRIIVKDSYLTADTSSWRTFFVKENLP